MFEFLFGSMIVFVVSLMLFIPILIVYFIALWKIFNKAGHNGWEAIIPFYNTWVLAEISGSAWWYALIIIVYNLKMVDNGIVEAIISLAAIVSRFFIFYNLSKKFHKEVGFAVLMTVFPIVMIPIIGFSNNYKYDKDVVVSENGPIGENNFQAKNGVNNYTTKRYCQYCGKQIHNDVKYCGNCGAELKK